MQRKIKIFIEGIVLKLRKEEKYLKLRTTDSHTY